MKKKKYLRITLLFIIVFYIVVNLLWEDSYKVEGLFRITAAVNLILIAIEGRR